MSAVLVDLCDAIVDALNNPTTPFVFSFQAKRRIAQFTEAELYKLRDLDVSVYPGETKIEQLTRGGGRQKTYHPAIAILRRLDGLDTESRQAHVDQLLELVEQIERELNQDFEGLSLVGVDSESERAPFNYEAMQSISFFSVAITLDFIGDG